MTRSADHIDWPRLAELVHSRQRFVLTSHVRPDCDALGSELGMAGVLTALGKSVRIVNSDPTPKHLAFIDPHKRILTLHKQITPTQLNDTEVLMVLDTSAWSQLGNMADVVRDTTALRVVIDHHVSADDLQAETFKDPTAEATGRLVFEAAEHLGVKITREIAIPLFAAVATDTGWFRFNSTNERTLRCAAALIQAGVEPAQLYKQLYEQYSLQRLHLMGRALSRVAAELDGRLVYTYVTKQDFAKTNSTTADTEDFVNMTLTVGTAETAFILVEQPSGMIKVSFRSRGDCDCARLAEQFGGGGHRAAAGAMLDAPIETALARALDAARAAMR
jgi:phosphoesterase RecJ-like protein